MLWYKVFKFLHNVCDKMTNYYLSGSDNQGKKVSYISQNRELINSVLDCSFLYHYEICKTKNVLLRWK